MISTCNLFWSYLCGLGNENLMIFLKVQTQSSALIKHITSNSDFLMNYGEDKYQSKFL